MLAPGVFDLLQNENSIYSHQFKKKEKEKKLRLRNISPFSLHLLSNQTENKLKK